MRVDVELSVILVRGRHVLRGLVKLMGVGVRSGVDMVSLLKGRSVEEGIVLPILVLVIGPVLTVVLLVTVLLLSILDGVLLDVHGAGVRGWGPAEAVAIRVVATSTRDVGAALPGEVPGLAAGVAGQGLAVRGNGSPSPG